MLILVGGLIILIVILFLSAARDLFSMLFNIPSIQRMRYGAADLLRIEGFLDENPYFKHLNAENKITFRNRVITFIVNKEFIGKDGIVVTEQMKVLIASTAMQLTFGLDHYIFPRFSTIIIFPGEFGYPGKGVRMKGGTTEGGKMYLSWKDFTKGMTIPDDGYNLGLHEFAHALKIEYWQGETDDQEFDKVFPLWYNEGLQVMQAMKDGRSDFLRKYAMTNPHEFFAVSVERFFETPKEFRDRLPRAYYYLSALLRQNPADQAVAVAQPLQTEAINSSLNNVTFTPVKKSTNDSWHWSLTIFITAIFIGIPAYIWLLSITDISTAGALILSLVAGSLNLVSWPYFRERDILNGMVFTWYSYIGVGVWSVVLVFALNFIIPVTPVASETYLVVGCSKSRARTDTWSRFRLENDAYYSSTLLRTFYNESCHQGEYLELDFRTGILGLRSLHDHAFR